MTDQQSPTHKLRVETVEIRPDAVVLIDQLALPHDERYVTCATWQQVADRIRDMTVRGAPAIGVTAAGGLHLAARAAAAVHDERVPFLRALEEAAAGLAATRPTAVNLTWAIAEMRCLWMASTGTPREIAAALYERAVEIHDDDIDRCLRIGSTGPGCSRPATRILTHCNAGALATAGYGTALGVIRAAHARHGDISVFVDETRPWLQGARLTAWELEVEGIPFALISRQHGRLLHVDRARSTPSSSAPTASPPTATRPTRSAPTRCRCWPRSTRVPFYVAAPLSTVDASVAERRRDPDRRARPRRRGDCAFAGQPGGAAPAPAPCTRPSTSPRRPTSRPSSPRPACCGRRSTPPSRRHWRAAT